MLFPEMKGSTEICQGSEVPIDHLTHSLEGLEDNYKII